MRKELAEDEYDDFYPEAWAQFAAAALTGLVQKEEQRPNEYAAEAAEIADSLLDDYRMRLRTRPVCDPPRKPNPKT